MQCVLATPKPDDDWRRTTIFHIQNVRIKNCKVIIDEGNCMNVVSKSAIERMNLKFEPCHTPYKVAWVEKTLMSFTQGCLVPLHFATFEDQIWCDVLFIDVAQVLLGRP